MNRTPLAALLAAPVLLALSGLALANPPTQCFRGAGGGGFCLSFGSKLHQHGPLFNYGPYYGYPPFEPYGPWNAYLQYNPWYYGTPDAGHGHGLLHNLLHKNGCGGCGLAEGWHSHFSHGGWFRGDKSLTCCGHKGGFSGCHKGDGGCGLFHKNGGTGCGSGCGSGGLFHHGKHGGSGCGTGCGGCVSGGGCTAAAFDPETTDPITRYSGSGSTIEFAGFYAGLPTLNPAVVPVGGLLK